MKRIKSYKSYNEGIFDIFKSKKDKYEWISNDIWDDIISPIIDGHKGLSSNDFEVEYTKGFPFEVEIVFSNDHVSFTIGYYGPDKYDKKSSYDLFLPDFFDEDLRDEIYDSISKKYHISGQSKGTFNNRISFQSK